MYHIHVCISLQIQVKDKLDDLRYIESQIKTMYEDLTHRYPDEPNPRKLKQSRCYAVYSARLHKWARLVMILVTHSVSQ
jgi:hypothetical protein